MSFTVSVFASVIGTVLVMMAGTLVSVFARRVLTDILGRFLKVDIEFVYNSPDHADADIKRDLSDARSVYIITGRGMDLQRSLPDCLGLGMGERCGKDVRVLLPDPDVPTDCVDWIAEREAEVAQFDADFGDGILRTQVETTVKYLQKPTKNGQMRLRGFNYPHVGRIIITNREAYFTPYRSDRHSQFCRVIKYRAGGDTYECLHRLFDNLWKVGRDLVDSAPEPDSDQDTNTEVLQAISTRYPHAH